MNEPTPTIGDNIDKFTEHQIRVDELVKTANEWLAKCPEIKDEDQAGRANDFRNQIRAAKKAADESRKAETDPLREQVKVISDKYKTLVPFLDESFNRLGALVTPWLEKLERAQQEKERQAREEAEAKRREAEEAAQQAEEANTIESAVVAQQAEEAVEQAEKTATAVSREKTQVRGDLSDKATGFRTTWSAEITNIDKAFDYYRDEPKLRALLVSLASADARSGRRRIPGFEVKSTKSVS